MTNHKIKIAIVDDHLIVVDGVAFILKAIIPNIQIVITAENGKDFISQLKQVNELPDIAIIDLEMKVMGGIETVKWIKDNHPSIKILILTQNIDEMSVCKIIKLGVNGYCEKGKDSMVLIKAIKIINDGGEYFPGFVKDIQNKMNNNSSEFYLKGSVSGTYFSDDELKIIELCSQGLINKEIADRMKVHEKTVEKYLHKIYMKTGVKRKTELITYAINNKLIKMD